MRESTIAALASPPGTGGISIVRISGPQALDIAARLFRRRSGERLGTVQSHRLYYGHIAAPADGRILDEVLLAVMRRPRTYTREDVVEIHSHGSPAAVRAILQAVLQSGAEAAEPGEFTRRAFLNGRIDLTQAEAVMDLIEARSERALEQFASQLDGSLRAEIERYEGSVLRRLAGLKPKSTSPMMWSLSISPSWGAELVRPDRRVASQARVLVRSRAALARWSECRHRRPPERRQIQPDEPAALPRARDCHPLSRHHPRRDRGLGSSRWIVGNPVGHGRVCAARTSLWRLSGFARASSVPQRSDLLLFVMEADRPFADDDHADFGRPHRPSHDFRAQQGRPCAGRRVPRQPSFGLARVPIGGGFRPDRGGVARSYLRRFGREPA